MIGSYTVVHNSDSDPLLLLNMTRELLELISAEAGLRVTRLAGDRWLVAKVTGGLKHGRQPRPRLRRAAFGTGKQGISYQQYTAPCAN